MTDKINKIYEVIADKESIETTLGFEEGNKPVMIGDVLDYLFQHEEIFCKVDGTKIFISNCVARVIELWEHKRKPIEEQPNIFINYIYNLVKDD